MPNSWKGIIAGFCATVVLSILINFFHVTNTLTELDIVGHIDKLGSIARTAAWVDHFIVGTLLWGPIFSGYEATTPTSRPRWIKGLMFGAFAWVMMMIIFMPVIGAGLFGWRLGLVEPIGMLVLHLLYGLVLGVVFDLLDKRYPAKGVMMDEPPLPEFAAFKDKD